MDELGVMTTTRTPKVVSGDGALNIFQKGKHGAQEVVRKASRV
jgi:hypothetical protein